MGKRQAIEMVLVAILCEGHVLMEDVPGVGQTMLAHVDKERALLLRLQREHPIESLGTGS